MGKYDIEFIEVDAQITDPITKFGGQPVWLESNFGDAGIGYAYISEDGRSGKSLWQCY